MRLITRSGLFGLATLAFAMAANPAVAAPKTSPLIVIATIVAKPDQADSLRTVLVKFAASTRREKGCVSYTLYEDEQRRGRFYTYEAWTEQGALTAHMTSPAMQAAVAAVGPFLESAPVISPLKKL